jgi:hypothetical protein
MIVECPYCHMTLLDHFNGPFRCWWCHIWLRQDQIEILGENNGGFWNDTHSLDLHPLGQIAPQDSPARIRVR